MRDARLAAKADALGQAMSAAGRIGAVTMAISLWPIWAWLVAFSGRWPAHRPGKRVENRSWATSHRGGVLIQAGLKWDPRYVAQTLEELERHGLLGGDCPPAPSLDELHACRGKVIARARIVDCRRVEADDPDPWAVPGNYAFELAEIEPVRPVKLRGQQGLFRPPLELVAGLRPLRGAPRLVNCKRHGSKPPAGAKYIGRALPKLGLKRSPVANGFPRAKYKDRSLPLFRAWLARQVVDGDRDVWTFLKGLSEDDVLACWCTPEPCHGHALIAMWRALERLAWEPPADVEALERLAFADLDDGDGQGDLFSSSSPIRGDEGRKSRRSFPGAWFERVSLPGDRAAEPELDPANMPGPHRHIDLVDKPRCPAGGCHPETGNTFPVDEPGRLCPRHFGCLSSAMRRALAYARKVGGAELERVTREASIEARRNSEPLEDTGIEVRRGSARLCRAKTLEAAVALAYQLGLRRDGEFVDEQTGEVIDMREAVARVAEDAGRASTAAGLRRKTP